MAEDDWALRAQAVTQREEIELLRGAVAALRNARSGAAVRPVRPRERRIAWALAVAFSLGVVITAAAMALYRVALCP